MEIENNHDSSRIARNTIMLYSRMFVLLFVGLYTSRVILQALGVEDYGLYNVISGFLSMFSLITGSMSAAIGRFITVELGKKNVVKLRNVFETSLAVQIFMGVIVILIIESFGIWFLDNEINIPSGRETAAYWCLHCATIITFLSLIDVPFNSAIIAHEKMGAFAVVSLIEAFLKLGICFLVMISSFDKLVTYSCLGVIVSILVFIIYWIYCIRKFSEISLIPRFHKSLFKEILGFAGWNFFGNASWILNTQGINMLMNIFFGVIVNAARGIANQVNGVVQQFVSSFMMALNPQIIKSYASGDKDYSFKLACKGARFSFYIVFIIGLPLIIEADFILRIWLGTPPAQSGVFLIWTIISSFFILMGNTLITLINAQGDIKKYQIWMTLIACLPFPLSWLIFELGGSVIMSYIVYTIIYWILIFIRFYLVHEKTGLPAKSYLLGVVVRCHVVGIVSSVLPVIIVLTMPETVARFIVSSVTCILCSGITIYYLGIEPDERAMIVSKIKTRIKQKCI